MTALAIVAQGEGYLVIKEYHRGGTYECSRCKAFGHTPDDWYYACSYGGEVRACPDCAGACYYDEVAIIVSAHPYPFRPLCTLGDVCGEVLREALARVPRELRFSRPYG